MKYILLVTSLLSAICVYGQNYYPTQDTVINGITYSFSHPESNGYEVPKVPKAGNEIEHYLAKNLHYPRIALKKRIEGRVIIKFAVNVDGSISDCEILKGIGGGCDEEALKAVGNMPPWIPCKSNGANVKVYFTLPIGFKLPE